MHLNETGVYDLGALKEIPLRIIMTMNKPLMGKSIAILVADGFEQAELEQPYSALLEAGASVDIVSPNAETVRAWSERSYGDSFKVDATLGEANPDDYDALLLPGGVMNPDKLRTQPEAVNFVRAFFDDEKPVAAICHGPQMLIEAGTVRGKILTSYRSLKTDLINAGAQWIDQAVVVDQGLVTSRTPDDLPQFNAKMIEAFCGATYADQL
jgi:protease I